MLTEPTIDEQLLARELPKLYAFAFQVSGSRAESERHLRNLVRRTRSLAVEDLVTTREPRHVLLGLLARAIEEDLRRTTEHSFEQLDLILRSDLTRPIDVRARGLDGDPQKIHVMLWELKRTCLIAVLGCVPTGVRLAFALTELLGFSPADGADLLGITETAYRVRLTRARKRVEDYLAPRCYHVARDNPCSCTGRLMIALENGFIRPPPDVSDIPHEPHDADGPRQHIGGLYRGLPEVALRESDLRRLLAED